MTQQELEQLLAAFATKLNVNGKTFAAALENLAVYSDREDAALKARQDELEERIARNEADHKALQEAEVIELANRLRQEFEEAGVDVSLLNSLLDKIRNNELKITELGGKIDTLRSEMDTAKSDISALKGTQADHAKRIRSLELREDEVGIDEAKASELDRAAIGTAFKILAAAVDDIAVNILYTAPVTGLPFDADNFSRKTADAGEEEFSDVT